MEKIISIVVPCYNEEESIEIFYNEIEKVFKTIKGAGFELIFIDDGSNDKSKSIMQDLSKKDERVKYVSLSRNFGKEAGMYAGLSEVTGDYAAIMDVDLQDPPEYLKIMYETLEKEDYDCVALYTKSHEGYSAIRKSFTNLWYKLIDRISNSKQMPGARDFRLMTKQMVDTIISMQEYNRYIKGFFGYIGFKTKWISYNAPERKQGVSKYSIKSLFKYAIEGITSFSTLPLIISVYVGLLFCLVSFIVIIGIIIKTLVYGDPTPGWPSLACIIIFVSGIQLFFLGIIGTYISKIYLEVKNRPVYIIKEKNTNKK